VQYNAEFIYLHEGSTSGEATPQRVDYINGIVTNGGNRSTMFVRRRSDAKTSKTLQFVFNESNAFFVVQSEQS
jgi:hypothetical protein